MNKKIGARLLAAAAKRTDFNPQTTVKDIARARVADLPVEDVHSLVDDLYSCDQAELDTILSARPIEGTYMSPDDKVPDVVTEETMERFSQCYISAAMYLRDGGAWQFDGDEPIVNGEALLDAATTFGCLIATAHPMVLRLLKNAIDLAEHERSQAVTIEPDADSAGAGATLH